MNTADILSGRPFQAAVRKRFYILNRIVLPYKTKTFPEFTVQAEKYAS